MKYMRHIYLLMKAIGAVKSTDEDGILYKIYYYICRVATLFFLSYALISPGVKLYLAPSSTFLEKTGIIIHIAIYFGITGRVVLMYCWGDKFYNPLVHVDKIFKDATETNLVEKTMEPHVKFILMIFFGWLIGDTASIMFYTFLPLMSTDGRLLPIPAMYPFEETASPFYELTYISQVLTQLMMILNFISIDMYYICIVYLTAAQYDLLAHEFENALFTTLLKFGFEKDDILEFKANLALSDPILTSNNRFFEIYETMVTERYAVECHKTFRPFIEHHKDLLKFCSDLENFFSVLLLYFIISIELYCVFILFTAVASDGHYLQSAPYFVTVMAELLLMAFPGEFLVDQSNKLQMALYNSPWYLCHRRFRSLFKFMQLRTTNHQAISLGKFTQMDLKTYMWVMKSSFSYVTLLHSIAK